MSVEIRHQLVIVTGGKYDTQGRKFHEGVARRFDRRGFDSVIHSVGWEDGAVEDKIGLLSDTIESSLQTYERVSLLGPSAGGAMALAGFMEHPEIFRVATVCSRLNLKTNSGYPSFLQINSLLLNTLNWLEENQDKLTPEMRDRVATVSIRSGENRIPPAGLILEGAKEMKVPYDAKDHHDSVGTILRQYIDPIAVFIKDQQ